MVTKRKNMFYNLFLLVFDVFRQKSWFLHHKKANKVIWKKSVSLLGKNDMQ